MVIPEAVVGPRAVVGSGGGFLERKKIIIFLGFREFFLVDLFFLGFS